VFDFGRREVRNFLLASALYWCEQMHIDGLRVDAVASMLYLDYSRAAGAWHPNAYGGRENLEAVSFLQELTATVYKRVPGVLMYAEESTAWPGVTQPTDQNGLGFGFKWNMGWMHDTLGYMAEEPVNRRYHHNRMTFSLVYAFTENFILPLSHDEVVHGKGSLLHKMPGDRWQQLANLRALYAYMWAHPGKQLLFSGGEFAQDAEWSEQNGLDWWLLDHAEHRGVFRTVQDLNAAYRERPALWRAGLQPVRVQLAGLGRRGPQRLRLHPLVRRTARRWCAWPTSRACPGTTTGCRCRCPPGTRRSGTRCSTPTPSSTAAAGWATSAGSWRSTSRCGASPRTRCCACRRWACCGWSPPKARGAIRTWSWIRKRDL
jgi:1,4-alpha-glucan branching enzyme